MPELSFAVEKAEVEPFAAAPLLLFKLRVRQAPPVVPIHTVVLRCQIRIDPAKRAYAAGEKERLLDLFDTPDRWSRTLRPMLWTHTSAVLPPFTEGVAADLPAPCTFDFNVAATKYFAALAEGEAPLSLLFSGTIFYEAEDGALQVAQIPWDREASFRLPARVWKDMMDRYYPNSAWLCLRRDVFDRLYRCKSRRGLPTWEQALEGLLPPDEPGAMNQALVDRIVNAVLYEGYVLYPYRPSVKNRQRWTFGGVYPRSYAEAQETGDAWEMRTECLVRGGRPALWVKVRFLHLLARLVGELDRPQKQIAEGEEPPFRLVESLRVGDRLLQTWQEAVEREVELGEVEPASPAGPRRHDFTFPGGRSLEPVRGPEGEVAGLVVREQQAVAGRVEASAEPLGDGVYRVRVRVENRTPLEDAGARSRDEALMRSLVSTHTILGVRGGEFVSLLEPPAELREAAAGCRNVGTWPVLVGEAGETDAMLSSPIILYDHPQVAPESPGDLFDGAEIDEILSLRILTLTDAEKQAAASVDERVRALLRRTEALTPEQFLGLHGTVRGLRALPPDGGGAPRGDPVDPSQKGNCP